jgi:excisionase family DNA binding protein
VGLDEISTAITHDGCKGTSGGCSAQAKLSEGDQVRQPVPEEAVTTTRAVLEGLQGRLTCSIDEAAAALEIGRSTTYAAAHAGEIPVLRIGNRLLVSVPRLLAMLGVEDAQ